MSVSSQEVLPFDDSEREPVECAVHHLQLGMAIAFLDWRGHNFMSFFAWILLGLLAGFIASHLVNHRGEGMVLDMLLGIFGATIGGWLAHPLGFAGITRLNLYSLIVATCGAVVFLFLYHAIRRSVLGRRVL